LDLSDFSSPWIKAFKCRIKKTLQKPFDISVTFPFSSNIDGFVTVDNIEKQQQTF
jgi:hypothetical protein